MELDKSEDSSLSGAPESLSRRRLLAGVLGAYVASLIPWALAQEAPDKEASAFMALSAIIAGRQSLNPELAKRIYDALTQAKGNFSDGVAQILGLIEAQKIDPLELQGILDRQYPQLAPIPRKIATAWFLGVVEENGQAKVLAYESALNAVCVADVLKPPSYCYGTYGTWAEKPT